VPEIKELPLVDTEFTDIVSEIFSHLLMGKHIVPCGDRRVGREYRSGGYDF